MFQSPPGLVAIDEQRPDGNEKEREFSADYVRPLGRMDKLQLGYDLQHDNNEYRNVEGPVDPATGKFTPSPSLTNDFKFGRTIHALYATVNGHLGKRFSYIAGLRLEDEIDDTNQVTTSEHSHVDNLQAYPTLQAQYGLTDSQKLRFSYSHRVVRPGAEDLNPFPVFGDPQNVRAGNPHLRPEQTDSFEAGYEIDHSTMTWQATIYLRQAHDAFSSVSRLISPNVLLTTRENLGKSTAGGLELTGSGKFLKGLNYSLSSDIFYNRIDASNIGLLRTRSTYSFATKASFDLQATPRDQLQVSANYHGKRLTPQGYWLPSASINLGLRHQIRDDLTAVATVSDLLDRQRDELVIDTPSFHDEVTFRRSNRTAVLALTWTFAGQRKAAKQPQFDYSSDGGAGGSA